MQIILFPFLSLQCLFQFAIKSFIAKLNFEENIWTQSGRGLKFSDESHFNLDCLKLQSAFAVGVRCQRSRCPQSPVLV